MPSKKERLHDARKNKHNEYYTPYKMIEKELTHYKNHFDNKTIICNCNDNDSQFFQYFIDNFNQLKLERLIVTSYKDGLYTIYDNPNNKPKIANCNGDFRSPESVALLKQADIVVTNPPFSLFREFIDQILQHNKKFLVVGSNNAISYKETFNLIINNKIWLGTSSNKPYNFNVPEEYKNLKENVKIDKDGKYIINIGGISWFTNLEHEKRNQSIINSLHKKYDTNTYPTYDNYNAIEVGKVNDIPLDFADKMGVPISYLGNHNPKEFEIIGSNRSLGYNALFVDGKEKYRRLIIRNLHPEKPTHVLPSKKLFNHFFKEVK